MVGILALLLVVALLLTIPAVQTRVGGWVAERLSKELGAEVRIGSIAFRPFSELELRAVYLGDLRGDTLITVERLHVNGLQLRTSRRQVQARSLILQRARFALSIAEEDSTSNLTQLIDRLSSDTTSSEPWTIRCGSVDITGFHFTYHNAHWQPIPFGVDFEHVDVHAERVRGHQFLAAGDSIGMQLEELALLEKSGFQLDQLAGYALVSPRGIRVEQMALRTPNSHIDGQLRFTTTAWADYSSFNDRVNMRVELDSSVVDFKDIAYFAPDLEGIELPIRISGRVRGPVSELKGRDLDIRFGGHSWFRGHAELTGLPDVPGTFMLVDVDELHTRYADLAALPVPPFKEKGRLLLPPEVRELGEIRFAGNFTGFLHAFTAYGISETALGTLRTDLSYQRPQGARDFQLNGRLATAHFLPGALIHVSALGPMAANIRISGSGRSLATMKATLEGDFPLITFNDTRITGVQASGNLEPNRFNGTLHATDEHLVLDFNGLADLTGPWPLVDFQAVVQHADLKALGLVHDQDYSSLSMAIDARGRLSPDSLQGRVALTDISYCDDRGDHALGDLLLTSGRRDGRNVLTLNSDLADVEVVGAFRPTQLPDALVHVVHSAFPALRNEMVPDPGVQDFSFTAHLRNTQPALDLFVPGLSIDSGAVISGRLNSRYLDIGLAAELPGISYKGMRANAVEIVADKTMDVLVFGVNGARQQWSDSVWMAGISLTGKAYQDELDLALGWRDSDSGTNGHVSMVGEVRGATSVSLDLLPSRIHLGRGNWETTQRTRIDIDSSTVFFEPLHLFNGRQRVSLNGTISKDTTAYLTFELDRVQLANIAPFVDGPRLHGSVNAQGRVYGLYDAPFVLSHVEMDSVHVEHLPVGDITMNARWADGQRAITLEGDVQRGDIKALDFLGEMSLEAGNALDLRLVMDRFDLRFIDPYLPEGISDIQGRVSGTVTMTGPLAQPEVHGAVDLVDAGLRIDYLNTLYRFSKSVVIEPDMFALDNVTVHDEEGNKANVGATILHRGFKDWDYNVWGRMNGLLVLNTTLRDNDLYYGKAYATGDMELSGRAGSMEVIMDARTGPGTDIHFPVGGSTEVSPIGFVRFTTGDSLNDATPAVDLSGVSLDLKVEVTPDARFELIFDPTVGDILSGRGRGNLEMTVSQSGSFAMRGQVEVVDGDYLFTLRNVVNKRFQIESGGRIVWYGDPFDAQLDLSAVYRVRAPLYDIMYDKNEAYRRRVPVDVTMHLRDRLLNPAIAFEVRLPTVDESVRTQVNSVLSTEQELNQQVFALIVLNRFVQPSVQGGGAGLSGGMAAGTTGSELLSNQVSNWLSKLSGDLDLGVNYRPGNNLTQDELELAVSTQLLNERLLVNTNVGVQYGASTTQTGNSLIGDFQLEYLLPPEGRLRLKAFSVGNDRNLNRTDQALTTQGVGVAFREEFHTLDEFWQKVLNLFRTSEKDRRFD